MSPLSQRDPAQISTYFSTDKLQTKKLEIHVLKLSQNYMLVKYKTKLTPLGTILEKPLGPPQFTRQKIPRVYCLQDSFLSSLGSTNDPHPQSHESSQHPPFYFFWVLQRNITKIISSVGCNPSTES